MFSLLPILLVAKSSDDIVKSLFHFAVVDKPNKTSSHDTQWAKITKIMSYFSIFRMLKLIEFWKSVR